MSDIPMSFPKCSECGLSHPPVPVGEKCPLAKEKTITGEEINFNDFFVSLKNILTSQIKIKQIKDYKKLLGKMIVEITKIAEEYKEV